MTVRVEEKEGHTLSGLAFELEAIYGRGQRYELTGINTLTTGLMTITVKRVEVPEEPANESITPRPGSIKFVDKL